MVCSEFGAVHQDIHAGFAVLDLVAEGDDEDCGSGWQGVGLSWDFAVAEDVGMLLRP